MFSTSAVSGAMAGCGSCIVAQLYGTKNVVTAHLGMATEVPYAMSKVWTHIHQHKQPCTLTI